MIPVTRPADKTLIALLRRAARVLQQERNRARLARQKPDDFDRDNAMLGAEYDLMRVANDLEQSPEPFYAAPPR